MRATRRTLRQIAQQLPAKGFGTSSTETPETQNHHPRESQLQDLLLGPRAPAGQPGFWPSPASFNRRGDLGVFQASGRSFSAASCAETLACRHTEGMNGRVCTCLCHGRGA